MEGCVCVILVFFHQKKMVPRQLLFGCALLLLLTLVEESTAQEQKKGYVIGKIYNYEYWDAFYGSACSGHATGSGGYKLLTPGAKKAKDNCGGKSCIEKYINPQELEKLFLDTCAKQCKTKTCSSAALEYKKCNIEKQQMGWVETTYTCT
jgi:hypothetical protein